MSKKPRADILREFALVQGQFHLDQARTELQRHQAEPVTVSHLRSAINTLQDKGYLIGLGEGHYRAVDIKARERRYFELVRLVCFGETA